MNIIKDKKEIRIITYLFLLTIVILAILYILKSLSDYYNINGVNLENLYWLFSASAQSIATFFAFMLAGYTLFISNLNNISNSDESLIDIIEVEKKEIFKLIVTLSYIVCLSLVLNLTMIYLNGIENDLKPFLFIVTFISTIVSIIMGIIVVIYIISPNKITKIASNMIYKNTSYDQKDSIKSDKDFFSQFIQLENTLRKYVESKDIIIKSKYQKFPSLREIINRFFYLEIINRDELNSLLDINKYRNLLFHGQIEKSSQVMIDRLIKIKEILENRLKDQDNV